MTPNNAQDQRLEVIISDISALTVIPEKEQSELLETLRPLAEQLPRAIELAPKLVVTNAAQAEEVSKLRDSWDAMADQAETAIRKYGADPKDPQGEGLLAKLYRWHRGGTALVSRFNLFRGAAKTAKQTIIKWQQLEADKAAAEQGRLQIIADERARMEQARQIKAAEKLRTPELREQRLEAAAQIVAPQIFVPAPKAAVKTQARWFVESVNKAEFVKAAAANPQLIGFLEVNGAALVSAKVANSMFEANGVKFVKKLL